jgi:lipoprotein-anchoring transpeptidase ErfK/SrfK
VISRGKRLGRFERFAALLVVGPLLVAAGCSGTGGGSAAPEHEPVPVSIMVDPADGVTEVRPDAEVKVVGEQGTLTTVTLQAEDGTSVPGTFDAGKTAWTADGKLALDTTYTVSVDAVGLEGGAVTKKTTFSTLDPPESRRLKASSISPLNGSTVGVAQPLVVGFNHPVRDRASVQRALHVKTEPEVSGAWYWIDDDHVHYRPQEFWPAGTEVTLDVRLNGVPGGKELWGAADRTVSFTIGRQQVIRVDAVRKRMTVERNGKTIKTFPVSTGKKGWETRNGIKVIMEKVTNKKWTNEAIDAPEDYTLYSKYAMRMTNSGEFVHDAPWNTGNIGSANTSHGCVGMYPKDMAWLFKRTMSGDPVIITGSPRKYTEIWNRYMDWNVPWVKWSAGNA